MKKIIVLNDDACNSPTLSHLRTATVRFTCENNCWHDLFEKRWKSIDSYCILETEDSDYVHFASPQEKEML